jgi:predicted adenine nucleotide alpha hydrolase (AANH) superfamily ATPase
LNYYYVSVSNLTINKANAQQSFWFNNSQVVPEGNYEYDALYRLTTATGRELNSLSMATNTDFVNNLGIPYDGSQMHNYTHHYQYDELGNMLSVQSVGGTGWTRNYFYNTNPETDNNYLLRHEETGPDIYAYDPHGNMTQMPHLQSISWDYADRMSYASLGGGGEVWYVYNAAGERVRKVIENLTLAEERLYLGGYEIYTKKINGVVTETRETILVEESEKPSPKIYSSRYRCTSELIDNFRIQTNTIINEKFKSERNFLRLINSIKSSETERIDYLIDCFDQFLEAIELDYRKNPQLIENRKLFFDNIESRLNDPEFKIPSNIKSIKSYRE